MDHLTDEDLAFVRRFILASGSMKDVAREYGISYPTVRLRLDRLIDKIRIIEDHTIDSELEKTLRIAYAEGRVDLETMKRLLEVYRRELPARPRGES
jgi:hypothetical protein